MDPATEFVLRVETSSLVRSDYGRIVGQVWCEFGGLAFPERQWFDFPMVVVGWWLESVNGLLKGAKRSVDVRFMDGPYVVPIFAKKHESWEAEFVRDYSVGRESVHKFAFAPDPLLHSLTTCADTLLHECSANGWTSSDIAFVGAQRERLVRYAAKYRNLS